MSNINTIEDALVIEDAVKIEQEASAAVSVAARRRGLLGRRLGERGLTTVEYAIGIVLVITIVGAIIFAIQTDTFGLLMQGLFKAIFAYVQAMFKVGG